MEIDPIKTGAYGKVSRGDAQKAKEPAKLDDLTQEMVDWAKQIASEKASANKAANQTSSSRTQQFSMVAQSPPSVTPASALPAGPEKSARQQQPEVPGVDDESKYYTLCWVPDKGMKWIEVPDSSLDYALTYQSAVEDGFKFEELTDCDAPPE